MLLSLLVNLIVYHLRREDCASHDDFLAQSREALRQLLVERFEALGITEDLARLPGYWEAQGYEVQCRFQTGYPIADVYRIRGQVLLEVVQDSQQMTIYDNHPDLPPMVSDGPPLYPWHEPADSAQLPSHGHSPLSRIASMLRARIFRAVIDLPDTVAQPLFECSQAGDEGLKQGEYADAVQHFQAALAVAPKASPPWEGTAWLLASLAEAYFFLGDYGPAYTALTQALHVPGALGTPFLHLRLGQVQFELGELQQAAAELKRAYQARGEEIFADEDDKYLEFLRSIDPQ